MRECRRLLVAALVLGASPVLGGARFAAASGATPSACVPAQVVLSATSQQSTYTRGTLVHITVGLRNRSATTCSFATGPFSPSFVLTNSAGVTVWGSCWFGGGPAPCAEYLRSRTLAPGAVYRDRLTWDQRTGHPDLQVPAGRYRFTVSFSGHRSRATTAFSIRGSRNLTATFADSGRQYSLAVGDNLTVRLLDSSLVWTTAVSSDPRVVVALPEMNPVSGLYIFHALAPGTARVSAVGNPACYPQCLMASRLFFVTVNVRAP